MLILQFVHALNSLLERRHLFFNEIPVRPQPKPRAKDQ